MTATGRTRSDGLDNSRQPDDAYMTPRWVIGAILDAIGLELLSVGAQWHEPCAGLGAIPGTVVEWAKGRGLSPPTWELTDIRDPNVPDGATVSNVYVRDFLQAPSVPCDVILTNPPFSMAEGFVLKARREAAHVVMLLRLGFLATKRRRLWLCDDMPDVYVLPQRPAFIRNASGHMGSDASDYAWLHWSLKRRPEGRVRLLGLRPAPR